MAKGKEIKVKALQNIVEDGRLYSTGTVFTLEENRARELGDGVEILEKKEKEGEKVIVSSDKMMRGRAPFGRR